MKRITKKRIATFAAGLALAALVNTPAFPQSQGRQTKQPVVAGIIKVPRQVRINPNRIQVAPGDSSHQDKPFVMLDPNGKPISPNAVYAGRNGKTEGKDVIGYLNRTGKKLEEHGYSLNSKMVQVKTVQNNSKPGVISARHVSRMMPRLKSIAEIENEIRADIQRVSNQRQTRQRSQDNGGLPDQDPSPRPGGNPGGPEQPGDNVSQWGWDAGDRDTFAIATNGRLVLSASPDGASISGQAAGKATVFGNDFDLGSALSDIRGPKNGPLHAGVVLLAGGQTVFRLDENPNTAWTTSGSVPRQRIDESITVYDVDILIASASFKVGFKADIGLDYAIGVDHAYAKAHIRPSVNSYSYAQFAAAFGVPLLAEVSGSVSGHLTLLDYDLVIEGQSNLGSDASLGPYAYEKAWAGDFYHALDGKLVGCVKVSLFGWEQDGCWTITQSSGYVGLGELVNKERKIYFRMANANGRASR